MHCCRALTLASSTWWPQKLAQFLLNALTLSNSNRFSKFFQCQNQEKICNNIITKDPTTSQACRYTTLWNVSVLKATNKARRLLKQHILRK